jgi:MoaA/NifB/PqqE/SkfB family radical SAM enzyme
LAFRSKLSEKGLSQEINKLDTIIEYLRIKSDPDIRVKGQLASGLAVKPVSFLEHLMSKAHFKKHSAVLERISTLQFEVTNNCNLHCNICWRSLRGHQVAVKSLTLDKFTAIMDKLLGVFCGIREVNTQGLGEPLLCPEILEILADTKRRGLTVWFVSNGTLLDENMAGRIVEIGVDKIRLSVDSADPEIYAAIKAGGSLEKVVQNITRLNRCKSQMGKKSPVIAFNSVLMKRNSSTIASLIELARLNLVQEVTLIPLVSFSRGLSTDAEQVNFYEDAFHASFSALKKEAEAKGVDLNLGISLESKQTRFCNFGFYIDADCFVHPCCNISTFSFGNIYKQDVKVIVRNYLRFRRWLDVKNISCKECNRILDKR